MTTNIEIKQNTPLYTIKTWLKKHVKKNFTLIKLDGDAGFRCYYKVKYIDGTSNILMVDNDEEQIQKYIKISEILRKNSINTPHIIAYSIKDGALLQADFGDNLLSSYISKQRDNYFYKLCIDEIIKIQKIKNLEIRSFCYESLYKETMIAEKWFFEKHGGQTLTEDIKLKYRLLCQKICKKVSSVPEVFVHRDYHSRNIFILDEEMVGIIDFQDAVNGPVSYDLVSLLRDYYNPLKMSFITTMIKYYHNKAFAEGITKLSLSDYTEYFYLTAIQRHLKVLGIFTRLAYRDNKFSYLAYLPNVFRYLADSIKVLPEYEDLLNIIEFSKVYE